MTLLVTITIPTCSTQTKSALTSDLIFLSTLLMLLMWVLNSDKNLELLSLFWWTMICFLKGFFITILILYLGLLFSLIIFWMFSILFVYRLENISLILRTSLVLLINEFNAWVYNFVFPFGSSIVFSFDWLLFLKNLVISLTSLGIFAEIRGSSLLMLASLSLSLTLLFFRALEEVIFSVNLAATLFLKEMLLLL